MEASKIYKIIDHGRSNGPVQEQDQMQQQATVEI